MNTDDFIDIQPIKLVNGIIDLPGSKSISNRALLLAAQSTGTTRLINLLESDDVLHMLYALKSFGVNYQFLKDKKICKIEGIGGALCIKKDSHISCFLGNSGTSMRLLTAALSLREHKVTLTGDSRMKERPIEHLVDALRQGGAKIQYLERIGYPPLQITGGYYGGDIVIKGNISSQYLSGILMMAPLSSKNTCIYVDGHLVSKPYIEVTLSLMKSFGVRVYHENYRIFHCKGGDVYKSPGDYLIEGDASSASYFLAAAAIRGGTVSVRGIGRNSIQGDIHFSDVLERMGAIIHWGENHISCTKNMLNPIDMDLNHIPDAAMTVAVTSLFVKDNKFPTVICNIYNWRLKESDRLLGMATELRKSGAIVTEGDNYLEIIAPDKIKSSKIHTYNDHRMAMAFSLLALSDSMVTIFNPLCVNKTFPSFFRKFMKISVFQKS